MNHIIKKIGTILVLLTITKTIIAETLHGVSFFSPRSLSTNSTRDIVGKHIFMHKKHDDSLYGTISITPQYMKLTNSRRVAESFWGTNSVRFSGNQVASRTTDDILADYFGMSPTFDSTVTFIPRLTNFLFDFSFDIGLDAIKPGLYFSVHAPFAWTKAEVLLKEELTNNGRSTTYDNNYMDNSIISAPLTSAKTAFSGDVTFGHMTEKMKYGKINGAQEEKKFSDIQFSLGYEVVKRKRGYIGISIRGAAPTGTKPSGEYFFGPVIGNGNAWELGCGLNGMLRLWEKDDEQTIALHATANIMHLFKSRQHRSFDFSSNGFGSRFILLKKFDTNGSYDGTLLPAINVTTLACDVSVDVQLDALVMASYTYKNWTIDFGYNGWLRTHENISIIGTIPENAYGFKGIQNVGGAINQNKTESRATLNGALADVATQDARVDNPSPVFIKTSDLDATSAAMPFSLTHKLFAHINYAWNYEEDQKTIPYLGIGFEIEFEGVQIEESQPNNNSMAQIGFWIKSGIAF